MMQTTDPIIGQPQYNQNHFKLSPGLTMIEANVTPTAIAGLRQAPIDDTVTATPFTISLAAQYDEAIIKQLIAFSLLK